MLILILLILVIIYYFILYDQTSLSLCRSGDSNLLYFSDPPENFSQLNDQPQNDKITVVFSLVCNDKSDIILDLIKNIKACFINFNVIILLSTVQKTVNDIKSKVDGNVIFVTVRDLNTLSLQSEVAPPEDKLNNFDYFNQHILNMKHILNTKYDFDYFWLVTENELFIKKVTTDFFDKNIIRVFDYREPTDLKNYYNEFNKITKYEDVEKFFVKMNYDFETLTKFENNNAYYAFFQMRNDPIMLDLFKKNSILLSWINHESLVLPKAMVEEISSFFIDNCTSRSQSIQRINYPIENILISSYINSKFNVKNLKSFCLKYNQIDKYKDFGFIDIYKNSLNNENVLSLKPIPQIYDNPFRTFIRNNISRI